MKVFCLALAIFFVAIPVSGHVLESSGSVAALMHIDPNDDPSVGQPSTINFLFQNDVRCGCSVTINGENIYKPRITPRNISFDYTFPKLGLYTIVVTGKDFSLIYKIDIDDQANSNIAMAMSPGLHTLHIGLLSLPILIGLGIILSSYIEKRNQRNFRAELTSSDK